jgi:hypothetical protein
MTETRGRGWVQQKASQSSAGRARPLFFRSSGDLPTMGAELSLRRPDAHRREIDGGAIVSSRALGNVGRASRQAPRWLCRPWLRGAEPGADWQSCVNRC